MKKDGHYILPLPLKNSTITLPNNRNSALHRMNTLKKKCQRQQQFFEDYKAFMNEMITKGYASKSTASIPDGKTWYIPHFGIYDPNKPGKIRVVFDCSAQFKGTSLNQHLMSGPDLTSQLVGVLLRFRQKEVAFMADIEKMFYRVVVQEIQRNLLRFLWWRDSNFNQEPQDYHMNVHLFGTVSSPSCTIYALKRTAKDFGSQDTKEIQAIKRDFDLDDLLKSVSTTSEGVNQDRRPATNREGPGRCMENPKRKF